MIRIKINNIEFFVKKNISILEACRYVGIFIPRFCYHEKLSIAGNCRMCLVDNGIKLVSSCTAVVEDNPQIFTDTPMVKKARENVIESLLLNHPLDCPICDQGGECDLQDQTKLFGGDYSRFFHSKRGVEDKECGPLIKTIMTRCIHCTRCVRYGTEVAGVDYFGTLNRGGSTEIGNYIPKLFDSEISGNVIDLCPVGALTSKPYAFKARPWELRITESIDLSDSLGSNVYFNLKETHLIRVLPKNNININENWISDKARFSFDALETNRLKQPTWKKLTKLFGVEWSELLESINNELHTSNTLFIFDSDLDLTSLNLLKKLQRQYPNKVNIKIINQNTNFNNFDTNIEDHKLNEINKNINTCFIISSNVRLESAILNSRLRSKYSNETFNLITTGLKSKNNIPSRIINLRLKNILNLFEGKSIEFSELMIKYKNPLIIVGESFKQRFNNLDILKTLIKKYIPSSLFIYLENSSNSKGVSLVGNILPLNSRDINNANNVFCINLQDNYKTRQLLKKLNKKTNSKIYWMNSHLSDLVNKIKECWAIPALSFYEDENLFINLEGKIQKTLKAINGPTGGRSIRKFISLLLQNDNNVSPFSYLSEILKNSSYKNVKSSTYYINNKKDKLKSLYSVYPIKSTIEDFYRTNNFLKNSPTMWNCSNKVRKNSTNFN